MPGWREGREVDDEAVAVAIIERFPELRSAPVRRVGRGWDNAVIQIGDLYARVAIREVAEPLMRMEWALLPRLQGLPFATPVLRAWGEASADIPGPWMLVEPVPGQELAVRMGDGLGLHDPVPLARGLRALHDPRRVSALPQGLPEAARDRFLPQGLEDRIVSYRERALQAGLPVPSRRIDRLLERTALGPTEHPVGLVHGDLHLRHVIVDAHGGFTGLIDWGDAGIGPPVADLGVVYWGLTPEQRAAFLRAYGPVSDATLAAARRFAAFSCLALWVSGSDLGQDEVVAAAQVGLGRVLSEAA